MNKEKFAKLFSMPPYPLQNKQEFWWLIQKVQKLKPLQTVIEIGFDKGGSFKFWGELVEQKGLVVGVDMNNVLEWDYSNYDRKVMLIIGRSENPEIIQKIKNIFGDKKIDFIYFDGCHEEVIYQDYMNYSPLVRKGGLLGFHDCGELSVNYLAYHGLTPESYPNASLYERGGAPHVKRCFESIKGEKERLQFDQGTGIVYR